MDRLATFMEAGPVNPPAVHYTMLRQPVDETGDMRLFILVATAVVGSDLWRMEYCCGGYWGDEENMLTERRAVDIHKEIKEHCEKLGVEFNRGLIEEI